MSTRLRGYDMRIQRAGSGWMNEKRHAWGGESELPDEWEALKKDATVIKAVIFHSTQRARRPQYRKLLQEYQRS